MKGEKNTGAFVGHPGAPEYQGLGHDWCLASRFDKAATRLIYPVCTVQSMCAHL